jgi:hypothetical protein
MPDESAFAWVIAGLFAGTLAGMLVLKAPGHPSVAELALGALHFQTDAANRVEEAVEQGQGAGPPLTPPG